MTNPYADFADDTLAALGLTKIADAFDVDHQAKLALMEIARLREIERGAYGKNFYPVEGK